MLLPILILFSILYLAFAVISLFRPKTSTGNQKMRGLHPIAKFALAGGIPILATATMTYLFLIVRSSTTVQQNAGSSSAMDMWSTWVILWPVFLFLIGVCALGNLTWIVACSVKKTMRSSIGVSIFSFLLSVLAFCTVISYFPSA